ncbi:hypothetical protein Tco_0442420 [Tanacetum coccineum]
MSVVACLSGGEEIRMKTEVKHVVYLMLNASPFEVMFEKEDNGLGSQCMLCQDTILGDVNAQTRFEITSKQSIDPPLSRGYTLGSGEDSMKLIGIDGILLKLVLPVFVSAVKRMLMLPVQVSAVEGISKEVGTPRYLSLVVPLTKVGDEAVHKELGDRMERAATTASSLEAEQDSGSGPRCQDTILGDVNAQTRFEITSKQSIDPPLSRGYTLRSGEDSMKLIGIDGILYTTVI